MSFDRFGQISPADIVETDIVEGYFGSYRAFDFNLHRVNYDKWKEEQLSENPDVPHIDLQIVEPLMSPDQIAAVLKKARDGFPMYLFPISSFAGLSTTNL